MGPRVVITINGAKVVDDRLDAHPEPSKEHPALKRASGRIGLQAHNGRVEFRNLRITELRSERPVGDPRRSGMVGIAPPGRVSPP